MKTTDIKSKTEPEIIPKAENHKDTKALTTNNTEGFPLYPSSEDIYNQAKKEMDVDPEDISKNKAPNEAQGTLNELNTEHDMSGDDLDIPGSELDDREEKDGGEDEENNYYSLGGDDHNELDEDNG
jgi:hypothetical protein